MRKVAILITVFVVVIALGRLRAQSPAPPSATDRKVTARVAPNYPELAKRMRIHGIVKVEAVVRPNGTVKSTRVLGGNPVLVEAAADAVKQWKFQPGQNETTEVLQLTFDNQ